MVYILEVSNNKTTQVLSSETDEKFRYFTIGPGAPIGPCGPIAPLKMEGEKKVFLKKKKAHYCEIRHLTSLMYTFDPKAPFSPFWPRIPTCP